MKKKKTVVVVIVIIVAVILLVVAGWLIYKKFIKKDEEKNDNPLTDDNAENPIVTDNNTNTQDRPADVLAFQKFAKSKGAYLGTSGSNKDGVDGIWGGKTASAWAIWKGDFLNKSSSNPNGYQQSYVDAWYAAQKAGTTTFVFENKTYNTDTGRAVPAGSLPTATTTQSGFKVGDNVWSKPNAKTIGYKSASAFERYLTGGTRQLGIWTDGQFYANEYVGVVRSINSQYKTLAVENIMNPMTYSGNTYTIFWVKQADVTTTKPGTTATTVLSSILNG